MLSFIAHVLSSNKIRVLFDGAASSSFLSIPAYTITIVTPLSIVPTITSVDYYDDSEQSVVLSLDIPLTYNSTYSLAVSGTVAPSNFIANVQSPPIAIGAWQSKRGFVDIVFDRSVGPTSAAATFGIRDTTLLPPGVLMTQSPWAAEGINENTIRVELPVGTPAANSYVIDFAGIVDESNNNTVGSVPLTLSLRSPLPYSYAKLTQLQMVDAFVTDVNEYLEAANVRVYFNGPVLDASTEANWNAFQSGFHTTADTFNVVASPDPINLMQLLNLVNEIKLRFNNHIVEYHSHVGVDDKNKIVSPDAFDIDSVYVLVNEMQTRYINHLSQSGVHAYDDSYNVPSGTYVISTFNGAVWVSVNIRNDYNTHAQTGEIQLYFSHAYGSTITNYARYLVPNKIIETCGPYTSYVDLKLHGVPNVPTVRIEASLTSEDGVSITSVLNYTGNIVARSEANGPTCLSDSVLPDSGTSIFFDKESLIHEVTLNNGTSDMVVECSHSTTIPTLLWALNNTITAFNEHISLTLPSLDIHIIADVTSTMAGTAVLPLSSVITAANLFKDKINEHMESYAYHNFPDVNHVAADDATDLESLIVLVDDIREVCSNHMVSPVGPHNTVGPQIVSAPMNDIVFIPIPIMNGNEYTVSGHSFYTDYGSYQFTTSFTGLATRPSLSSAIPRTGTNDVSKLTPDFVDLFFSKPMLKSSLSSSNVTFSGGISQLSHNWIDSNKASICVIGMEASPYTVVVTNLVDEAGNLIY